MILEHAILNLKPNQEEEFEKAFSEAKQYIEQQKGFISLELQKCIEHHDKYLLLVKWEDIEAHELGFRQSEGYQHWKKLLHHFYEPFPVVEHYKIII